MGGLDYIVPFMISVLMAKAVGDSLNEGPALGAEQWPNPKAEGLYMVVLLELACFARLFSPLFILRGIYFAYP